ncbi:MAG: IS110 family transposase [Acidobacteriota bacterium]|nr:IS110 family transposase [Acidobacteriota bacterium]
MSQARKRSLKEKKAPELPVLNPTAAGIDIGATEIYVAVHPGCDPEPVRSFSTFTEDLHRLADWLKACQVDSVAMESTGVYWIPLFQILEARGFEVCLVNARYYQNVPGRRTDVSDCQWLRHLHSVGLLRPSFRPADQVCALRSLVRHRDNLIRDASSHVLRMQKALNQMNLQIHHVISDITGVTGLRILEAVLSGERDPAKLAALRDGRIKASEETIVKALVGDYRREHLFTLRQSLAAWRNYQKLMAECDQEIEEQLTAFDAKTDELTKPLPAAKVRRRSLYTNEPSFDLRGHLYRIFGVDLTAVPGISVLTAHTLLAEVGPDLSRFRSGAAFASWLGLCPDNDISGGKKLSVKTRPVNNRAAGALRMAVNGLYKSQTWLGNFFRRMRAKLGAPKAITAAAHKLARITYQLLTTRQPYDESIYAKSEQVSRLRTEAKLTAQAKALGFHLVPAAPTLTQKCVP